MTGSSEYNRRRGEAQSGGGAVTVEGQTVDEVLADVDAGKVSAQAALDAERAGKNRVTLISALESRLGGD